jgi:hypothetical protein
MRHFFRTPFHCLGLWLLAAPLFAHSPEAGDEASLLPEVYQPGTLADVIERLYGQPVLDFQDESGEYLEAAAVAAMEAINAEGVTAGRVNEVGNAVEAYVIAALNEAGFVADRPQTVSGRHRSAGYPDVVARRGGETFYIEVKTYHPRNVDTTQRSFYLSPSDDPKVTEPAFHLLLGFAMEPEGEDRYFARGVRLLDIADLPLELKLEFNASNRDLYGEETALQFFSATPEPSPLRQSGQETEPGGAETPMVDD